MPAFLNKVRDKLLDMALGSKAFLSIVGALLAASVGLAHRFITAPLTLPPPWGAIVAGYVVAVTAVACWLAYRIIKTSRPIKEVTIVDTDLALEWHLRGDISWWLRVDPRELDPDVFHNEMTGRFQGSCRINGFS